MIFAQGDLLQAMSLIQDGRCADAIAPLVKVYKSSFRNSNGEKAAVMLTECYLREHKRDEALKNCNSKAEEKQIQQEFKKEIDAAEKKFKETVSDTSDIWKKATEETVKAVEESKIEKKKNDIEEKVRDHLRGSKYNIEK